ncbi:ankyrin repeat-containing protein NPR4-like [Pistacia vera]|uniref:ankyrin repeat-containing protein NPR4-like n=1 Tax=Pistacia vera TaxID=55513 RepID=UPI001262BB0D|nr:ankyrin repeat-containing protein NPR4-like [Pistacia vera]
MNGLTCLHLLALMPSAFPSTSRMGRLKKFIYSCLPSIPEDEDDEDEDELGSKNQIAISRMFTAIWKRITEGLEWPKMEEIWKEKRNHAFSKRLVKLLVTQDVSWNASFLAQDITISIGLGQGRKAEGTSEVIPLDKTLSSPETPLIMAARTGIKEIVYEILKEYPEAVDHVSENEQNILHVAIMHRNEKIFNLIQKKVINLHRFASKIDHNGYTILHHVADMTYYHATRPGPAFQLQEELEWSKRVKEIMPNHYDIHRNKNNMTAEKLFEEKHKEKLNDAKKWVKKVASSCSVVAVLVASVVFAAAYTVPGGTNKRGLPNFLDSSLFLVFTIMDVISLASSFTSLVMFLSILTSPLKMKDFRVTLPQILTIGFTFLFISVITTMITFAVSLFLILRHMDKRWTLSLVFISSLIPVLVFAAMHFRLYAQFMETLKENFKENVLKNLYRKKNKKTN